MPIAAIAEDLWGIEWPFCVAGIRLGARMTIVRLPGGRLWLHSPVPLDAADREALDALGSVRYVVAPSKVHHMFVAPLLEAHPKARLFGAPGLADKRPELSFHAELGELAPSEWAGEIEQTLLRGAPMMNEVIFFHPRTRTLIVTDAAFNIVSSEHLWTRTYLRMMGAHGGFRQSKMVRLCVRDRDAARRSIARVLEWDFDRVIVTHGAVLETGGKAALRAAFAWLGDAPRDGAGPRWSDVLAGLLGATGLVLIEIAAILALGRLFGRTPYWALGAAIGVVLLVGATFLRQGSRLRKLLTLVAVALALGAVLGGAFPYRPQ
jgi:hypothetical protein